ncbi:hypothetical protein DPMN_018857 [Dreissena polymorpha]|uniref:Uncharacterized protein n=1 Tax=Dreissena polymorpha TaxID=45954 RepID=A0A9D4NI32_DREPO|nr:hypothetical protein DPMN_018857 [Dreissena polymorpha]
MKKDLGSSRYDSGSIFRHRFLCMEPKRCIAVLLRISPGLPIRQTRQLPMGPATIRGRMRPLDNCLWAPRPLGAA